MKRQSIAPRHHAKGRALDALAVALLMALMAALGCVALLASPVAKADSDYFTDRSVAYAAYFGEAVCWTLDDFPSSDGVLGIISAIQDDGLNPQEAAGVMVLAVNEICPRHDSTLRAFVARYGTSYVA